MPSAGGIRTKGWAPLFNDPLRILKGRMCWSRMMAVGVAPLFNDPLRILKGIRQFAEMLTGAAPLFNDPLRILKGVAPFLAGEGGIELHCSTIR